MGRVTFKTFESGAGDCMFLVFKDTGDGSSYHIMVDCNVLTEEIKKYIREDLEKRIDMLIVTHIDSDHANGITKLMRTPDFADMQIKQILFNGFQPKGTHLNVLSPETKAKLEAVAELLPPTVDADYKKTNGMDAACLITEMNKHPQWKAVWRKAAILAGETIPLGQNEKWGRLKVLSPTQEALDDLLHEVKLEYAKRLSIAPPDGDFEDQDKYYELMLRLSELRNRPNIARKTTGTVLTKYMLERYAKTNADESKVTYANKASLAFSWEGGEPLKRILLMGDAVSSQVMESLHSFGKEELWFEAVKVSHHGSKHNTSIDFNTKVNSAHYFVTGGKNGEGPHIETIAKIAVKPLPEGVESRELHFNHSRGIDFWNKMREEGATQLLSEFHLQLSTANTYEFEY